MLSGLTLTNGTTSTSTATRGLTSTASELMAKSLKAVSSMNPVFYGLALPASLISVSPRGTSTTTAMQALIDAPQKAADWVDGTILKVGVIGLVALYFITRAGPTSFGSRSYNEVKGIAYDYVPPTSGGISL